MDLSEILAACQNRNEAAWREFVARYTPHIYRWCIFRGMSPHEAQDITQDVFLITAKKLDALRLDGNLHSWFFQTTRRLVANRKRLAWFKFFLPAKDDGPLFQADDDIALERILTVRKCLLKLPNAQSELLLLIDVEGFTRDEAADILGLKSGTVASRLRVARDAFKKMWAAQNASTKTPLRQQRGEA